MDQKTFVNETLMHIRTVGALIGQITSALSDRAVNHDASKLADPEHDKFFECTGKLRGLTYGSEEYKKSTAELGDALKHHYSNNSHHPEFHADGIRGMTLIDIVEMLCDWKAATLRHADGDIMKSIELQQKKLGFGDDLKQIFINTVGELECRK